MQGQKNTDTMKIENGLYWLKKKKNEPIKWMKLNRDQS